jgi:hypothetical protein
VISSNRSAWVAVVGGLHLLFEAPPGQLELAVALGTVYSAVDRLRERGVVERAGSEFRVPADDEGPLGRVSGWLGAFAAGVARPVTLEFEDEKPAGDESAVREREFAGD